MLIRFAAVHAMLGCGYDFPPEDEEGRGFAAQGMLGWSAHLDPLCVDVPIQDNPLVLVGLVVGHVPEGDADDAFLPLPGGRVQVAVQLIPSHRLLTQAVGQLMLMQ